MLGVVRSLLLDQSQEGVPEVVDPTGSIEVDGHEEQYSSLTILTMLSVLALAMALSHMLDKCQVAWASEASVALVLGMLVGSILNNIPLPTAYDNKFAFKSDLFFILILPPIIFDAGFGLDTGPFFGNIGAICVYAFAGTLLSTGLMGLLMWVAGLIGMSTSFSITNALLFGAIISATDPVSVLAIFNKQGADQSLYALVFGEAALNDAVAIVIYNVLIEFKGRDQHNSVQVLRALGLFVGTFVGSMFIGIFFGLLASLTFKTGKLRSRHAPLEATMVILVAYGSYYLAEGLSLSGIVSILFCGITMAKYCRPNLSLHADQSVTSFFRVLTHGLETFVFIYIGISGIKKPWASYSSHQVAIAVGTIVATVFALASTRGIMVAWLTKVINRCRPTYEAISRSAQIMIWWAGLRGAMAFALANKAQTEDLKENEQDHTQAGAMVNITFFVVVATVLINGGASSWLLNKLNLKSSYNHIADTPTHTELALHAPPMRLRPMLSSDDGTGLIPAHTHSASSWGDGGEQGADGTNVSNDQKHNTTNDRGSATFVPGTMHMSASLQRHLDKVREFNRSGGVTGQLSVLDRHISKYVINAEQYSDDKPTAGHANNHQQSGVLYNKKNGSLSKSGSGQNLRSISSTGQGQPGARTSTRFSGIVLQSSQNASDQNEDGCVVSERTSAICGLGQHNALEGDGHGQAQGQNDGVDYDQANIDSLDQSSKVQEFDDDWGTGV